MRVIVPPGTSATHAEQRAARAAERRADHPHTDVHPAMDKTDIAHRPYQVATRTTCCCCARCGERIVITHQDLIAYRNPGYFPGYPQWERLPPPDPTGARLRRRRRVLLPPRGARHAARGPRRAASGCASSTSASTTAAGRCRRRTPPRGRGARRAARCCCAWAPISATRTGYSLCACSRRCAKRKGWDGTLVLAGPAGRGDGSSAGEEAAYLATRPDLAGAGSRAARGQRGREGLAAASARPRSCIRRHTRASG